MHDIQGYRNTLGEAIFQVMYMITLNLAYIDLSSSFI